MTPERLMEKTCFTCMVVTPSKPVDELLRIGTKRVKIMTSGLHIWMKVPVSNRFVQYSIVLTDSFGFEFPVLAIYITRDKKHRVPCCRHVPEWLANWATDIKWSGSQCWLGLSPGVIFLGPLINRVPPIHPVV